MKYIAKDSTHDDIWLFELASIPEELRIKESELRQSRWFDYRNKLPMQLTQLFADTYCEIYKEMYAKLRDYEYAEKITGNLSDSDLISLWLARQAADAIGCPYGFYIRFAMTRTYERCWKYLPRPNQLYGEELLLDAKDVWDATRKDILYLAESNFYKTQSYMGHPDQHDYHRYLVDTVKMRAVPEMILTRLIFREKCLPEELAVEHFGDLVVKTAMRHFHA
jgi:hypothetical protein